MDVENYCSKNDFSCSINNWVANEKYTGHIQGRLKPNISTIPVGKEPYALYNS
jgi:hypothetical protein